MGEWALNQQRSCHFFFFYKDLQRSISRNNHMASSRPEQHATSVLCKTHFNGTDCCTLYNSSPVELPQQESGNVCTWKWQLNVCVHLCVLLVGSESSFTDGEKCPQVREDWDKDMKRGWPGSQRKTTEEQRNCSKCARLIISQEHLLEEVPSHRMGHKS